jgi:hypothetical protein
MHADVRVTAARDYLATAPPTDFTRLLAGVVDLAQDCMDMDIDQKVSQVLYEGGVYLAPLDLLHLCPVCFKQVEVIVAAKT